MSTLTDSIENGLDLPHRRVPRAWARDGICPRCLRASCHGRRDRYQLPRPRRCAAAPRHRTKDHPMQTDATPDWFYPDWAAAAPGSASISWYNAGRVDWRARLGGDEAADAGDGGVRALRQDDAAGGVSGRDGAGGAVAGAVRFDPAGLSEDGQRPAADRGRADAAPLLPRAVVQLVGPAVEEALYNSQAMRAFAGSTSAGSRCRTRPRCVASAICSRRTISVGG